MITVEKKLKLLRRCEVGSKTPFLLLEATTVFPEIIYIRT